MGYESKLFFVQKTRNFTEKNGKTFGIVQAMVDIHKFESVAAMFENEADTFIYQPLDGNVTVDVDKYGNGLKQMALSIFIDKLGQIGGWGQYVHTQAAMTMALTYYNVFKDDMVVLHYGY